MASIPLALVQSPPISCWSNLPLDLMQMIFERLGFSDFERARCVCSSWQSGSRKSQPNNKIPWMILFPLDKNYALLLNPQDKERLYKTQDLSNDFAKSCCVATCNSWLLMGPKDISNDESYILHLLTRERINLPLLEFDCCNSRYWMLWVDEKTKDYKVIGMLSPYCVVYLRRGDNSWNYIAEFLCGCDDIVYKDHKLYCRCSHEFKVFDLSGDIPLQVLNINYPRFAFLRCRHTRFRLYRRCMVVTIAGDVLIVKARCMLGPWEFEISKVDSRQIKKVTFLGDESIILDLGITVLAKDLEGIDNNSIYFSYHDYYAQEEYDKNHIFIYNLDTKKVKRQSQFVSSSIRFFNARWFLPNFKRE